MPTKVRRLHLSDLYLNSFSTRYRVVIHHKDGTSILLTFIGALVSIVILYHFIETHK